MAERPRRPTADDLTRVVRAKTGPGIEVAVGEIIAYTEQPTVKIRKYSGSTLEWVAHLCEVLGPEEELRYWRDHALALRAKLKAVEGAP